VIDAESGTADPRRVDVSEADDVRYWCEKCGCSESQLRTAVKSVGVDARDVQVYLKKREVARFLWREGVR
jgi:hypothetical protein